MTNEANKRVLVADDEADMRTFLTTVLELSGYEPIAARDGEEALSLAAERPPDLVILDLMMPRLENGMETYRRFRTDPLLSGVPVVMLSAIARQAFFRSLANLAIAPGCEIREPDAYLEKPPDAGDVLAAVAGILARAGRKPPRS